MYVYEITNLINGKSYIGKTTQPIEKRWYQHCKNAEYGKDTYLYRAIRKYGVESFEIMIVEEVVGDLNVRERHWISCKSPAYNMTEGGDGGAIHNQLGNRWKVKDSSRMGHAWRGKRRPQEIVEKFSGGNNYQSTHYIHTPWGVFETWNEALAEAKNLRLTSGRKDVITDKDTLRKYCTNNVLLNAEGRRTFPAWRGRYTKDIGFYMELKSG